MKNKLPIVFFVLCSICIYAQDTKYETEELGFLENDTSIKKGFTFYELLEKSIHYKETNRQEEFKFNGISYRGDITCSFTELLLNPATKNSQDADVRYYSEALVRYYFKNAQLKYKIIERNGFQITTLYLMKKEG